MTAEEKAQELFNKYSKYASYGRFEDEWENVVNAKNCALISVNEILTLKLDKDQYFEEFEDKINYYSYWNEVKNEIKMIPKAENI